jgi:hypothetical protein
MKIEGFCDKYNLKKIFEQITNISQNIEKFTINELWKWTKFDGSNELLDLSNSPAGY